MEKTQIQCYNQRTKEIPSFVEKQNSGKPYLNYGNNNQFPQYLWELYLKSAILQSIINGSADYVMGSNIQTTITIADKVNKDLETLEDIIKKLTIDYFIFGGFALQVIFNKLGEIAELYWLDFRNIRVDKECKKAFYSDDWVGHSKDFITYDLFDTNKRSGTSVFYFNGHLSRGVYPIPRYNGALAAIETSTEISKFHLNSILNNFSSNFIINFNNGQPSEDVQEAIERRIKEKFTGTDNAGKFMVSFNDSKENGVTVERIQDDSFDQKYEALRQSTFKEIFVAFRCIPQLFGYSLEGTGFNKQEFLEAFELYNTTTIRSIQKDLVRCFNKIFGLEDSITFTPFNLEGSV